MVISTTKDQGKRFYLAAAAIKQHFNVFDCALDILISYCSLFDLMFFHTRSFVGSEKKSTPFNLDNT